MLSQQHTDIQTTVEQLAELLNRPEVVAAYYARRREEMDFEAFVYDARQEGRAIALREMVEKSLAVGIPIATIVHASGFTEAEVLEIQRNMAKP
jgi:hypothetical protein